ncbi:MAG: trimethylamine methyltransferase family protein, partial [Pseudomonadota bacterium]
MPRERRGGNRRRRGGDDAKSSVPAAPPYIKRKIPYFEMLNDEQLTQIEYNADTILEEIGIVFGEDPESRDIFKAAGATIEDELVKFPRGMCREIIQNTCQAQFTQHARNPAKSVEIGGDNMVLVPAYGPPFVFNMDEGR